jgi:diadenosine tetraphosphate (Ap4A) HIT family hydrolase
VSSDQSAQNCPFCDPLEDRIFLRDDRVLGLWDAYSVSPGHALLVPQRHIPTWFEATAAEQVALVGVINDAKAVIQRTRRPDGYNIGIIAARQPVKQFFTSRYTSSPDSRAMSTRTT